MGPKSDGILGKGETTRVQDMTFDGRGNKGTRTFGEASSSETMYVSSSSVLVILCESDLVTGGVVPKRRRTPL